MNALQLKMARAALGLTVRDAAEMSGTSHDTITRLERGEVLKDSTVQKVRAALESAGVIFVDENGQGPGVRMRRFIVGDRVRCRPGTAVPAGLDLKLDDVGTVILVAKETGEKQYRLSIDFPRTKWPGAPASGFELVEATVPALVIPPPNLAGGES